MKEWLLTLSVVLVVFSGAICFIWLATHGVSMEQKGMHISDYNIVELNWDGCQYLRFGGTERILIHKSNCTNAVHWKELERRP